MSLTEPPARLGDNLRAEMARKNLSQEELAQLADVSVGTVKTVMATHRGTITTLEKLAAALRVPVSTLLPDQPAPPVPSSAQDNGQQALSSVDPPTTPSSSVSSSKQRPASAKGKRRMTTDAA